jgi:hypothetical protein
MTNKELGTLLINSLKKVLTPLGFKFIANRRSFQMKNASGYCAFHLAFIQHVNDFDVVADLGIRLDAVHELADPKGDILGDATFGIEIGNYTEGSQKRWTVNSEASIEPVVNELEKVFNEIALPYFRKYSNTASALELLETTKFQHCSTAEKRSIVIATLKRLLNSDVH